MPLVKLLSCIAVSIAGLSALIAVASLLHRFLEASTPEMIWQNLEIWISEVAYHLSLIVLAAAATVYLARKK